MDNFDEEYLRIKTINNPALVADELHLKSFEFRDAYHKRRRKERNDRYRQINKTRLNEERRTKYKEQKSKEDKPIIHQMPSFDINEVDTTIKRNFTDSKKLKDLTQSSIKAYTHAIKKTYQIFNNTDDIDASEIIKYLQGIKHNPTKLYKQNKYIITNVKNIAENHSYLIPQLYKLFSRFNTKKLKEFREVLYPYFTAYNENYTTHRNDLIVNEEEVAKISFIKEDILENASKIDDTNMKILYLLMFMIPTRRLADYRLTKIAQSEEDTKNTDFNWYYNDKIYINNTKNKHKMILDIPLEIANVIKTKTHGFPYLIADIAQSTISQKFRDLTNKIYGAPFVASDIRKIYATHNLKMGAEFRDITQMLKNQVAMGHILTEHLKYVLPSTSSNQTF